MATTAKKKVTTAAKKAAPYAAMFARLAVSYATMRYLGTDFEKAQRVLAIVQVVRDAAGGKKVNTVALLMELIRKEAKLDKLSPADRMVAEVLLETISQQLVQRVGSGKLTGPKLLKVGELADWILASASSVLPRK